MDIRRRIISGWDKFNYKEGIRHGFIVFKGPDALLIEITNRCSMSCVGCEYHDKAIAEDKAIVNMEFNIFKDLITQARQIKVREIIVTGQGEPFLHPYFLDMVRFVKAQKMYCNILTNGLHLNKKVLSLLNNFKIDRISLSLWGLNDNYSFLHNVSRGSFSALRELLAYKQESSFMFPKMVGVFVVSKLNYNKLTEYVEFAEQFGFDSLKFKLLRMDYDRPGASEYIFMNQVELDTLIDSVQCQRVMLKNLRMRTNIDNFISLLRHLSVKSNVYYTDFIPCYIGWLLMVVKLDGSIIPCCRTINLVMGNIYKDKLRDVYFSRDYSEFRKKISQQRLAKQAHTVCKGLCPDFNINFSYAGLDD